MSRKKTMNGFLIKTSNNPNISEILALALIKLMRSSKFKIHLQTNKYLVLMYDHNLMFMNDISFFDGGLCTIETRDLERAIMVGKIGDFIKRKAGYECSEKNEGYNKPISNGAF